MGENAIGREMDDVRVKFAQKSMAEPVFPTETNEAFEVSCQGKLMIWYPTLRTLGLMGARRKNTHTIWR